LGAILFYCLFGDVTSNDCGSSRHTLKGGYNCTDRPNLYSDFGDLCGQESLAEKQKSTSSSSVYDFTAAELDVATSVHGIRCSNLDEFDVIYQGELGHSLLDVVNKRNRLVVGYFECHIMSVNYGLFYEPLHRRV
jgi:hypothetical protein